ncbi:hypothetical protein HNY73_007267 [Argiope bruennichi]|uniref:Uncharacterized protein n=1 Tax=Argiope bruennichi TaxID=94029 RepID=A0A8T0FDY5_ARGBR|nr:hypothetical protein HNY73_007267 [Argiope bruennichi]
MAPKKKGKPGVHTIPEVHPLILKRREAERIKAQKTVARTFKKLKKKRKQTNTMTVSSNNSESSFPETFDYGTSGEESEIENSACMEPATSLAEEQSMKQETGCNNLNKETGKDRIKSQPDVPKIPDNATGRKYLRANIVETGQDRSKNVPIKSSGGKKLRVNTIQTQVPSGNKESIKKTKGKESLESQLPIKNADCTRDSSKNVPKIRKKLSEDLLKKKNKLQQKLETFESERKHLNEQRNKILSPIKGAAFEDSDMAIIGDIKLRALNEPDEKSDVKQDTYSYYDTSERVLHIGDEHIEISIFISQGSQVICKSKRRPLKDSNQNNVESDSQMLKSESLEKSDKDVVYDSEYQEKSTTDAKCTANVNEFVGDDQALEDQTVSRSDKDIMPDKKQDEMTTETKCTTNNGDEFASQEYQALKDQVVSKSGEDIIPDQKHQDEMSTEAKCTSNSVDKIPEENSGLNSVQESVKIVCENFLKDFISACEIFETRMRNLIKGDKNLKKK